MSVLTPDQFISELPESRKKPIQELRSTILRHLPNGFVETVSYGMLAYVIPHTLYPDGYHVNPKEPLPFISIAAQKNYISLYHLGLYADEDMLKWFKEEYSKHSKTKLDMGKSCIRFKKSDNIPFELIGVLCSKMTADQWVQIYSEQIKR